MSKGKKVIKILLVVILCLALAGLVITSLWNWLVPSLFNGPEITFWQALGLFVLAKILFGGWGGGHKGGGPHAWKHKYYEKFSSMTPEERERFKQKIREKWCSPSGKNNPPAQQTFE